MEDMCVHTCAYGRYVKVCVIVKACDCQEVSRACGSVWKLSGQMLGEGVSVSSRTCVAVGCGKSGGQGELAMGRPRHGLGSHT